ncbi:MAG: hypothetical protein KDC01_05765, partial [Flavobacteriales bacterium]|nr:hypothetical protein [Flavobacteriales bacterium]
MNRLIAILIVIGLCQSQLTQAQDIRAATYQLAPTMEGGVIYLNNLKLYVDADMDMGRDSIYVFTGANHHW